MNKVRVFGLSVSFLLVGPGLADTVDIPNQFQAGTPAVADEVNQNFGAAELAIDDNAADIAVNVTAIAEIQASVDALSSSAVKVKANGHWQDKLSIIPVQIHLKFPYYFHKSTIM